MQGRLHERPPIIEGPSCARTVRETHDKCTRDLVRARRTKLIN